MRIYDSVGDNYPAFLKVFQEMYPDHPETVPFDPTGLDAATCQKKIHAFLAEL